MKKQILHNQGFTIIETLVAVAIMMISIAGPLTIAYKSYVAAVYAHDQMTAAYLAQDAMEYVKNVRDTNLLKSINWLTDLDGCTTSCSVDTISGTNGIISNCSGDTCKLTNTSSGYGHGGGTATQFSRVFTLSNVTTNEAKATVLVTWTNGLVQNQVQYEAELFSAPK